MLVVAMAALAAAAAAAAGGIAVPPTPPLSTFDECYRDSTKDECNGTCVNVMNEFNPIGGRAPDELRTLATNDPKSSSLGYLYLVAAPGDPNHPGCLHAVHTLSEHSPRLGFETTQWDGLRFGTVGDILRHRPQHLVTLLDIV